MSDDLRDPRDEGRPMDADRGSGAMGPAGGGYGTPGEVPEDESRGDPGAWSSTTGTGDAASDAVGE
jgi:hypothetical protein